MAALLIVHIRDFLQSREKLLIIGNGTRSRTGRKRKTYHYCRQRYIYNMIYATSLAHCLSYCLVVYCPSFPPLGQVYGSYSYLSGKCHGNVAICAATRSPRHILLSCPPANHRWHNTCDIAEPGKDCLVEHMDGDGNVCIRIDWRSEYEWVNACHYDKILRWAYVSDLLPYGKEADR